MSKYWIVAVVLMALVVAPGRLTAQTSLDGFYGAFVGSGTAVRADGTREARDLDVTIKPGRKGGFELSWITVIRDEFASRTDPDVKRRAVDASFEPVDDKPGVFINQESAGLFGNRETPEPLLGDPVRWAAITDDTMTVYSAGIAEDGRLEVQIYHRTLTENGLDIEFVRMADEAVEIRVTGELTRTE